MAETWGNLAHAMRENYDQYGVDEYYQRVSSTYRNPFMPGIKKVLWAFMNRWWEAEGREIFASSGRSVDVLDMAAGSGEATLCLSEWASNYSDTSHPLPSHSSIATRSDVANTYPSSTAGPGRQNRAFIPPNARRGKGKEKELFSSTPPSLPPSFSFQITATDPYTGPAYKTRTGRNCFSLSFSDLASGHLPLLNDDLHKYDRLPTRISTEASEDTQGRRPIVGVHERDEGKAIWEMIICSFALHLVPSTSELWALLSELSTKAKWLVVIAPHKKPTIKETWGWTRWDLAAWQSAGEKVYTAGGRDEEEESGLELQGSDCGCIDPLMLHLSDYPLSTGEKQALGAYGRVSRHVMSPTRGP
ncbi:hypothetical protein TREMEDRAFT_58108 [Tremella mesenterica DSM 1558]|uniref:uncharacterized protein n=1 Tax=Tremella mesenterica (strain ATCC 24925 / CBS 8224 / DSM 1558 / NBRC 9311 / NRRL Y-6157 / RJB 2259-6 / UBC 559-6) TaxID=578456 RepID=UPI0003F4901D|nr:uncharacterized protein TREMEDRAFT_58108 [Tremella mesenterica DSM 1558]EIW71965.1 hypothetical protein TREMEDRAFT_58108 [Tremella mesenterica DSM 1558]